MDPSKIWENKASKELKSDGTAHLDWRVGDQRIAAVHFDADQRAVEIFGSVSWPSAPSQLAEYFSDDAVNNERLLEALGQGLQIPIINYQHSDLAGLLQGVHLDWIKAISQSDGPSSRLDISHRSTDTSSDHILLSTEEVDLVTTLIALSQETRQIFQSGLSPKCITWVITATDRQLMLIAALRAARAYLSSLISKYSLPCDIVIECRLPVRSDDMGATSLSVSSQMMSAMMARADLISLDPTDKIQDSQLLKTLRNSYYLLMEEAKMGIHSDPAMGSYMIDRISLAMFDQMNPESD